MDRDIEGWSLTARRLLRRLRHPSALEVDPEGIALRDALGTSTVFDAVSVSAERALAHADPRLLRIVQQCDFGDTTMKVQAHELHVSLRHVFRFRMKVFAALGIEMKRAIERRTALPRDASRAEAARLMARAQFLVARRGAGDDVRSIALAEQALAADPTRADAWCLIASANISLSLLGQLDADVGQARARAALACAEDLGTSRGVVLAIRSNMASTWSHEWSLAKSLACEAIETPDGAAGVTTPWCGLRCTNEPTKTRSVMRPRPPSPRRGAGSIISSPRPSCICVATSRAPLNHVPAYTLWLLRTRSFWAILPKRSTRWGVFAIPSMS